MSGARTGETGLRFALLGLAATGAVVVLAESLWYVLYLDHANDVLRSCAGAGDPGAFARCRRPSEHARVGWTAAVTGGVLAIVVVSAFVGSWLHRRPLTDLPRLPARADPVLAELAATHPRIALVRHPTRPTTSARADGIARRYVEVGLTWMAWAVTDGPRARAVLRHELAHHEARDVLPTRLTWWSGPVVATFAAVFVALEVTSLEPSVLAGAVARIGLVLVVVAAARAAVLRIREYDADLSAAREEPDALLRALGNDGSLGSRGVAHRLTRPFRTHPSASERRSVVETPARGLAPRVSDAVLVGLVAAVAGPVITRLVRAWGQVEDWSFWSELPGWGLAGAAVGAWLSVVHARLASVVPHEAARPAVRTFAWTLAAALIVGSLVLDRPLAIPAAPPATWIAAVAVAVPVLAGVTRWVHGLAILIAPRADRWSRGALIVTGGLVTALAFGLAGSILNIATQLGSAGATAPDVALSTVLVYLGSGPTLTVIVIGAAATIGLVARHEPRLLLRAGRAGLITAAVSITLFVAFTLTVRPAALTGAIEPAAYAVMASLLVALPVVAAAVIVAIVRKRSALLDSGLTAIAGSLVAGCGAAVVQLLIAEPSIDVWRTVPDTVGLAVPVGLVLAAVIARPDRGPEARRETDHVRPPVVPSGTDAAAAP